MKRRLSCGTLIVTAISAAFALTGSIAQDHSGLQPIATTAVVGFGNSCYGHTDWDWISQDRAVEPMGITKGSGWDGEHFILAVRNTTNGQVVSKATLRGSFETGWAVSPDGKKIAFTDGPNEHSRTKWVVTDIDGSHRVEFLRLSAKKAGAAKSIAYLGPPSSLYRSTLPFWLPDNEHFVESIPEDRESEHNSAGLQLFDLRRPGMSTRLAANFPAAGNWELNGVMRNGQAVFVDYSPYYHVDRTKKIEDTDIATVDLLSNELRASPHKVRGIAFARFEVSPRSNYLTWVLTGPSKPTNCPELLPPKRRMFASDRTEGREWQIITVSNIDGASKRQIGFAPWFWREDTFPTIVWTHDGKGLSFLCNNAFYTVLLSEHH